MLLRRKPAEIKNKAFALMLFIVYLQRQYVGMVFNDDENTGFKPNNSIRSVRRR
jgi:hypothetical protein